MLAKKSIKNIEVIREDATRLLEDLGRLKSELSDVGKEKLHNTMDEVASRYERDIKVVKQKVDELMRGAQRNLTALDESVHEKPYWYIVGAMVAGAVATRFLLPSESR